MCLTLCPSECRFSKKKLVHEGRQPGAFSARARDNIYRSTDMKKLISRKSEKGSVELIVIGLLAALIIVLAIPLLRDIGTNTKTNLEDINTEMTN